MLSSLDENVSVIKSTVTNAYSSLNTPECCTN